MKTNTAMFHLGGLARMSLAAAIAIGSSGVTARAGPVPSLPDRPAPTPDALGAFHVIQIVNNPLLCVQPQDRSLGDVIVLLEDRAPRQRTVRRRVRGLAPGRRVATA